MIKFLAMDVDGTLTDGKVYMGNDGEIFKAFDIKDGCGIKELLPRYGIIPVIITARNSNMLVNRCKELGIIEIHQGIRLKLDCLNEILEKYSTMEGQYTLANVAYIGDDFLDLLCLEPIRDAGGLAACPCDAIPEVLDCCTYVAPHNGGNGAVRDLIEYIIKREYKNPKRNIIPQTKLNVAIDYISHLDFDNLRVGKYMVDEDFYYTVQEYTAFDENVSRYESHREYIDIQWIVSGIERLYITDVSNLNPCTSYDSEKDIVFYHASDQQNSMVLTAGSIAILDPSSAHKPGRFNNLDCKIIKICGKLKI